jgi:hypothetical protein
MRTEGEKHMIRDKVKSPEILAVSYDTATQTLIIELSDKSILRHSPVSYETYDLLVHSRFPEKIYHRYLRNINPSVKNV